MSVSIPINFHFETLQSSYEEEVLVTQAVIAGWTGRDAAAMEKHIAELEELGVQRPPATPMFYRNAAARLTTADAIEVLGGDSSGEVEFVLVQHKDVLWVGTGSDHTDRKLETYNVSFSKQACDKPMAPVLWAYEDLKDHWDELTLSSYIDDADSRVLYQQGNVSSMLAPEVLVEKFTNGGTLPHGMIMFCGTMPAQGGVRPSSRFEFELEDPILGRKISHAYNITTLPVQ